MYVLLLCQDVIYRFIDVSEKYAPFYRSWNGHIPQIHLMKPEHIQVTIIVHVLIQTYKTHTHLDSVEKFYSCSERPILPIHDSMARGRSIYRRRQVTTSTFITNNFKFFLYLQDQNGFYKEDC